MADWEFANIEFLWALVLIPILIAWYIFGFWSRQSTLGFSATQFIQNQNAVSKILLHSVFHKVVQVGKTLPQKELIS